MDDSSFALASAQHRPGGPRSLIYTKGPGVLPNELHDGTGAHQLPIASQAATAPSPKGASRWKGAHPV